MQPAQIGKKMRIRPAWSLQKPLKHPVMIAFQKGPISSGIATLDQKIQYAPTVRPPVNIIPKKYDGGRRPTIFFNPVYRFDQLRQLAMNVTNCIERIHETSNSKRLTWLNFPVCCKSAKTASETGAST